MTTSILLTDKHNDAAYAYINTQLYNYNSFYCLQGPDMRLLHEIVVPRITADWSMVADYLKYKPDYKQLIRENCHDNTQRCCVQLLEDWFTSSRGVCPKSWSKLIAVLKEIESLKSATEKIVEDLATAGVIV